MERLRLWLFIIKFSVFTIKLIPSYTRVKDDMFGLYKFQYLRIRSPVFHSKVYIFFDDIQSFWRGNIPMSWKVCQLQ
jgi:hypothetical protein